MEERNEGSGIRCNEHPDAPHSFMRDASHSAGRYVCECESWEPPKEEQKPVAHITGFHNGHCVIQPTDPAVVLPVGMALYRVPTEWVGLTDEEIQDLGYLSEKFDASNSEWFDRWGFARAIEAKLKEKNHG